MPVKEAWLDREKLVTDWWKRSPAWHRSLSPAKCWVEAPQRTPVPRQHTGDQKSRAVAEMQSHWVIPLVDGRSCENNPLQKQKTPGPKQLSSSLLCTSQESDPKQLVEPSKPSSFGKRFYFKRLGEKYVHPFNTDLSRQLQVELFLLIPPHSYRYTDAFAGKWVLSTDGVIHIMKHISQKKVGHERQRKSSTSKHYSWEGKHRLYIGSAWSYISENRTSWEYKDHLFKPSQKLEQAQRPGFPTSRIKTSVCAQDSFKCKILAKTWQQHWSSLYLQLS